MGRRAEVQEPQRQDSIRAACWRCWAAALILFEVAGQAAAEQESTVPLAPPGGYGRLDVTDLPSPEILLTVGAVKPETGSTLPVPTVYLRIRPGEPEEWRIHCVTYRACSVPVRFVTERWYQQVYRLQSRDEDGSARRQAERDRRDRNNERESHPGHEED